MSAFILYGVLSFMAITLILTGAILYVLYLVTPKRLCDIAINDDPSLTKHVVAGRTLLDSLQGEGIAIPSSCGGKATCKQCRIRIGRGVEEPLETDVMSFSPKELREGWRLSCQVKVYHDLSVYVNEALLQVREWHATVISNENVASFVKELVVQLESQESLDYHAGAFFQIYAPPFTTNTSDWKVTIDPRFWSTWEEYGMFNRELDFSSHRQVSRAYSVASYPEEGALLRFHVRIATPPLHDRKISRDIPWGCCSSYLFSLKPNDRIHLQGPYGLSPIKKEAKQYIFLIGGVGSSFCRSHILQMFRTEQTDARVSLWYGARSLQENIHQKLYEDLERERSNFTYHLVLSAPTQADIDAGWDLHDPVKTNFLFKAFEIGALKDMEYPEAAVYYVCGPPMHNKSVLQLLDTYGIPRDNIVVDEFCG